MSLLMAALALAAQPTWQELANSARTYVVEASTLETQIAMSPKERQTVINATLVKIAACQITAAGIGEAWNIVLAALPGLETEDFDGTGGGPNRYALRRAALAVLHGMVVKAAAVATPKSHKQLMSMLKSLTKISMIDQSKLQGEAAMAFYRRNP
jgi:hypothetical protein